VKLRKATSALWVLTGSLLGAMALFAVAILATGSAETALLFSIVPFGFMVPIVGVFLAAGIGVDRSQAISEKEHRRDVAIAVAYTFSVIPYWFSIVSFLNGRPALGGILLAAYVAMALVPLQKFYRLRVRAHQSGRGGSGLAQAGGARDQHTDHSRAVL